MCDKHSFQFDYPRAFEIQLIEQLEGSPTHPLDAAEAPSALGVYAIYEDAETPAYVGMTSRHSSLRSRLAQNRRKLLITPAKKASKFRCRYLVVPNEHEVALAEKILIAHYKPPWNGLGFGSHTPGAGRPGKIGSKWEQMFGKLEAPEPEEEADR